MEKYSIYHITGGKYHVSIENMAGAEHFLGRIKDFLDILGCDIHESEVATNIKT